MTPNLVRAYKHAMERVYNVSAYVPETYHDQFLSLELELSEHHISSKHYAEAQAIMWKDWVKKLNLTHLPLNLFLSITAKVRYNKLLAMPSVEIALDRKTELSACGLTFERDFAKWYMEQIMYKVGIKDEEQALDTYLDTYTNENLLYSWLDYCEEYGRVTLIRQIIEQFCYYWAIKQVCPTYFHLACRYADGLLKSKRELTQRMQTMDWRSRNYSKLSKALENIETELDQLKYGSLL